MAPGKDWKEKKESGTLSGRIFPDPVSVNIYQYLNSFQRKTDFCPVKGKLLPWNKDKIFQEYGKKSSKKERKKDPDAGSFSLSQEQGGSDQ